MTENPKDIEKLSKVLSSIIAPEIIEDGELSAGDKRNAVAMAGALNSLPKPKMVGSA